MTSLLSEYSAYDRFKRLFDDAENEIRNCERISLETAVPSINELRYAGRHFLNATGRELNKEEQSQQFEKAERHCQRAIFDAKETIILTLLDFLADFQDCYYSSDELQKYLPALIR